MKVPAFSSEKMNNDIKDKLHPLFQEFIDSSQYILGRQTEEFEKSYAKFNQTRFAVGVANGLDALYISLKIAGVGKDDEVIVPSNTYIATWISISMCGAVIVPVEPDSITYNISPENIRKAITKKTKVILPVHLYGQICDMESIMKIADENNLLVIEDNAQSQGSTQNSKMAGSFGIMNATSFYPTKNIGAYGDGGAITTNDENYFHKIKTFRNYGSQKKYENEIIGINSRLDEIQSYFLSTKLTYLEKWNKERNEIAGNYFNQLENLSGLTLPFVPKGINSVYHQFVILYEKRDQLQSFLLENGVSTNIHYPIPPHLQKAYQNSGYKRGDFPLAEKISKEILSLPIYPGLTESQQLYVVELIKKFINGK